MTPPRFLASTACLLVAVSDLSRFRAVVGLQVGGSALHAISHSLAGFQSTRVVPRDAFGVTEAGRENEAYVMEDLMTDRNRVLATSRATCAGRSALRSCRR